MMSNAGRKELQIHFFTHPGWINPSLSRRGVLQQPPAGRGHSWTTDFSGCGVEVERSTYDWKFAGSVPWAKHIAPGDVLVSALGRGVANRN